MANVMAIVSKAVFEKVAGKAPGLGTQLAMDRYVSANKHLASLATGGRLYLVTVRPPDEALWLIAVLDQPKFDGTQWISTPADTPITDITALRSRLVFDSGKGITAAPGALGMSLQTPRVLATTDAALLDGALGGSTEPSDRRSLLLAAIIGDPDSAHARQVFADELSTLGDPRGEYIHTELALAGPLSIRNRDQLAQRSKELLREHSKDWRPYKVAYRAHAGFLEAVTGTLAQLDTASTLFDVEPIVEVTVTGINESSAAKLAKAKWLARLRRLIVRGSLHDKGFATLVAAKPLARLVALNVTANGIGAEGLAALETKLPACRSLVLTANHVGDHGIEALLAWQHLPQIHTLYLSKCALTAGGVAQLLRKPLPELDKLTLVDNALGDEGASAIAQLAKSVPALRVLDLRRSRVTALGVDTIMQAIPTLVRLDARDNRIPRGALASLAPRVLSE